MVFDYVVLVEGVNIRLIYAGAFLHLPVMFPDTVNTMCHYGFIGNHIGVHLRQAIALGCPDPAFVPSCLFMPRPLNEANH